MRVSKLSKEWWNKTTDFITWSNAMDIWFCHCQKYTIEMSGGQNSCTDINLTLRCQSDTIVSNTWWITRTQWCRTAWQTIFYSWFKCVWYVDKTKNIHYSRIQCKVWALTWSCHYESKKKATWWDGVTWRSDRLKKGLVRNWILRGLKTIPV